MNAYFFKCSCGYEGIRWRKNTTCKRCKREGKLIKLIKEK